jgi:hypothetical protein
MHSVVVLIQKLEKERPGKERGKEVKKRGKCEKA